LEFKRGSCGQKNKETNLWDIFSSSSSSLEKTDYMYDDLDTNSDGWSEWSDWSKCSGSNCDSVQFRTRKCLDYFTDKCKGQSKEYKTCGPCYPRRKKYNFLDNVFNESEPVYERRSRSALQSCGGTYEMSYTRQTTFIQSPNYPKQYPTSLKCTYLFKSPQQTKILLRFLDLDLEQTKIDSCVDSIEARYYNLGQPGPVLVILYSIIA
jgi:hypothetical protein